MKFVMEKNQLLAAINTVIKALPSKTPNPVLEGILIQAKQDAVRLVCSTSTLQIETTAPAAVFSQGETVMLGRFFSEVVRKLPDGDVSFELRDKDGRPNCAISSANSKTNIQCMEYSVFPEMPAMTLNESVSMDQRLLRDMIRQTSFAASVDENRPILTGVLFDARDDGLIMVGLDGFRLAIRREKCRCAQPIRRVVPSGALNEIAKSLEDEKRDVTLYFSKSNVMIDMGLTRINALLLSGEYLDYMSIIPTEHKTEVTINRRDFFDAIERASLMAKESKTNLVRFSMTANTMDVTSNAEIGNVFDQLDIHLAGSDIEIAFNSKYMTDVLSKLEDQEVKLLFNNSVTPCVVTPLSGDSYLYLVLPVRIFNS